MPKLGMEPLRRRQLIEATIEAIHDRGMNGVTMGDIARRADVSPALAHHYFGSKDELLNATLRHLLAEFALEIRHRLRGTPAPRDRIKAVIDGSFGAEQFPNEARATGLGLGYGLGASAKVFGPVLLGMMFGDKVTLASIPPAFTMFAALLVIGGVTYMFAQETKGRSLDSI